MLLKIGINQSNHISRPYSLLETSFISLHYIVFGKIGLDLFRTIGQVLNWLPRILAGPITLPFHQKLAANDVINLVLFVFFRRGLSFLLFDSLGCC